jgi:hypothetical protein
MRLPQWNPDGKLIAFTSKTFPALHGFSQQNGGRKRSRNTKLEVYTSFPIRLWAAMNKRISWCSNCRWASQRRTAGWDGLNGSGYLFRTILLGTGRVAGFSMITNNDMVCLCRAGANF